MTRTTRALAAGLLALALGAAGCSQGDEGVRAGVAEQSAPTPDADVPTATDAGRYARYVALGDSYTAAPLVPETDVTNGCLRSTDNYPALVAAALPGTELVDVSCSGADSGSMVGVQRTGDQPQPPQFDALTEETDLVTVGIGGNDFNLFATLIGTCVRLRSSDPQGAPCEAQFTSGGTDQLARELRQIRGHVAAIVTGIRDRAPHARVVVVGYPQILPDQGSCRSLLPLAAGDYAYARRINEGLAAAVERGAGKADAYVDTFGPSAGHDICADDPWINGQATDPNRALAFHPFAAEQKAVARLVLDAL
ncbi:SGNH/GDSL hydrolase family protein [Nocardioides koreensis]|uniref:SGNH/GDSL hydrolase family protein n=1 Tax=Nocardioides koreensis TaxID=433651 RepID=A0ABP5LL35_9ACTN